LESLFGDQHDILMENRHQFVDVIVPVSIPSMFTYKIPSAFLDQIQIGSRVLIQFGKKKILTGIAGRIHAKPPSKYEAKPILDVLDDQPKVNPLQIKFWFWMAEYYFCNIGEVMNAALPSGLKLSSESKIQLNPTFDLESPPMPIDKREQVLLDELKIKEELTYEACEILLGVKNIHPLIKSLVIKEAILVFENVKEKYSPKIVSYIRLLPEYASNKNALEKLFESISSKPKQEQVLLKYLQEVPVFQKPKLNEFGIEKKIFLDAGLSKSSLKTLIDQKVLEEFKVVVSRFEDIDKKEVNWTLSPPQKIALDHIKEQMLSKPTVLLHGITGSGKTEIYIQLIQEVLESGSQVLLLLPEIALTTHIVERLFKVFGNKMGVYHSKYSDNERVEVWNGVLSGQFPLIVGVRSSIFLPFDSLGLIIVDEEHESSYKQYDPAPRFQARDAAIMLAHLHQAKTLLGTATPSFESFYNAKSNKYGYVKLETRYGDSELPNFYISDILVDQKKNLLKLDLTQMMREKIQNALNHQEQVLIFQNRRGYAPYLTCEECGWISQCEHCDVSLTYHQFHSEMRCHYCGFKEKVPTSCPICKSNKIQTVGLGTEKIEENLAILFPEARISRMDLDTTRSKYSYQKILHEFGNGNIDILIGTQMITKGLDFNNVTVVGILDTDRILYYPDFRSGERAFQQITQVAGRAGRREKKGHVILQTRKPEHQIFEKISNGEYEQFYLEEIAERKKFFYPPFVKLIKVSSRHKEYRIAENAAIAIHQLLSEIPVKKILLGPEKALIGKVKNQYIFETIVKLDRTLDAQNTFKNGLHQIIEELMANKAFKGIRFVVDVDPG
jgi:primosomal protein N' (replication factor Y) (superfamily II helicase)